MHNTGGSGRQGLTMADLAYPRKPTTTSSQSSSLLTGASKQPHGEGGSPAPVLSKTASMERVRSTFFTNLILLGIDSYGTASIIGAPDAADQPHLSSNRHPSSGSIPLQPFQHPQLVDHVTIDPLSSVTAGSTAGRSLGISVAAKPRPLTVSRDMFVRSNQSTKALEFVLWFLLDKLDPQQCRERCKGCWPIMDRHDAREFRNVVFKWLDELRKEGCFSVGHGGMYPSTLQQQHKQQLTGTATSGTTGAKVSSSSLLSSAFATSSAPRILTARPINENTELGGSSLAGQNGLWSRLCINGMDVMATIRRSYLDESTGERIEQIILVLSTFVLWVHLQRLLEKQSATATTSDAASSTGSKRAVDFITANPTSKAELETMGRQLQQEVQRLSSQYDEEHGRQSNLCQQWNSRALEIATAMEQIHNDMSEMHAQRRMLVQQHLSKGASMERSLGKDQPDHLFQQLETLWSPIIKRAQSSVQEDQQEYGVETLFGFDFSKSSKADTSLEELRSLKRTLDRKRREARTREECHQKEQELSRRPFLRLLASLPSTEIVSAGSFRPLDRGAQTTDDFKLLLDLGSAGGHLEGETDSSVRQHRILESIQETIDSRIQHRTPARLSQVLDGQSEQDVKSAFTIRTHRSLPAMSKVHSKSAASVWTDPRVTMATTRRDVPSKTETNTTTYMAKSTMGSLFSRSAASSHFKSKTSGLRPVAADLVVANHQECRGHTAAPPLSGLLKANSHQPPRGISNTNKESMLETTSYEVQVDLEPKTPVHSSFAPRWSLSRKRQKSSESPVGTLLQGEQDVGEDHTEVTQRQASSPHKTTAQTPEAGFADQDVFGTPKKRRRTGLVPPARFLDGSLLRSVRQNQGTVTRTEAETAQVGHAAPAHKPTAEEALSDPIATAMAKSPMRNRRTIYTVPSSQLLTLDDLRAPTPKARRTKDGPMPLMLLRTPQQRKLFGLDTPLGSKDDRHGRPSPLSPVRPLMFSPKSPPADVPASDARVLAPSPSPPPRPSSASQHNKASAAFSTKDTKRPETGTSIFARFQSSIRASQAPLASFGKMQDGSRQSADQPLKHQQEKKQPPPVAVSSQIEAPSSAGLPEAEAESLTTTTKKKTMSSLILDRLRASSKSDPAKSVTRGTMSSTELDVSATPPRPRMAKSQFEPRQSLVGGGSIAAPFGEPMERMQAAPAVKLSATTGPFARRDSMHGSADGRPLKTSSSSSSSSSLSFSSLASGSTTGRPGSRQPLGQPPSNPWGRPPSWKPSSPKMVEMDKQRQAEKAKRRAAREAAVAALSMDLSSSRIGSSVTGRRGEWPSRQRPAFPWPMSMRSTTASVTTASGGSVYQEMVVPLNDTEEDGSEVVAAASAGEEEEAGEEEGHGIGGDEGEQDMDESSPSPVSPLRLSNPFRPLGESTSKRDSSSSLSLSLSSSQLFPKSTNAVAQADTSSTFFQRARKLSTSSSMTKPNLGQEATSSLPSGSFLSSASRSQRRSSMASQVSYEFSEPENRRRSVYSEVAASVMAVEDGEEDEPTIYNLALQNIFGSDDGQWQQQQQQQQRRSSSMQGEMSTPSSWNHRATAARVESLVSEEGQEVEEGLGSSLGLFDRLVNGGERPPWSYNSGDEAEAGDLASSTLSRGLFHEPMPGSLDPDEVL
ncbi:hypothetical protein BGZ73_006574 [Actinomortierella ambigua]|nr:hypothetical protein BGZ73_006574 [Actinomortierella ambigua]